ncbi:hypothetical protein ACF3VQ_01995 [Yersinia sp. HM-2024]|uniref:hypothetical protein n=1 Tax=Yersinia sp. HM-2024 TaxID=3344550 RepID=UPI00370D5D9A
MKFKFELNQVVEPRISDEWGEVIGRAEYAHSENQYFIFYKTADGRALKDWFNESELEAVEDDRHPGFAVYAPVDLPKGAVVE